MTEFSKSLAVIIGINDYWHGIHTLTTPVNDATRLAELLETVHGYEVHLLVEDVTKGRMEALFTEVLPTLIGEDGRLLIYFAGHGVALDGDDGPKGFLVPQDANPAMRDSFLPMTDLHSWLHALSCRHMLAILDCCFAGAFRWAATRNMGVEGLEIIHQERFDRYLQSPAWQVLTSAAYDQKALDVVAGKAVGSRGIQELTGERHSPFALALYEGLQGEGDLIPKGDGDGVITATELYLYLRQQVEVGVEETVGHEQTPGLWPLNKHGKGEFIFLTPGHELNLPPAPELTFELNPWRGLKSYEQRHRKLLFGRDEEIETLSALVEMQPFVAVLGASGTGKSSLVKAGLLPELQRSESRPESVEAGGCRKSEDGDQELDGSFHVLPPFRPTDQPIRVLEALLSAESDGSQDELIDDEALARWVGNWADAHPMQRLLITIDQFEELVTLCRDDAERERFLRLLTTAIQQSPDALRLIITLRTDFEPQFDADTPLGTFWQPARYVVPPMSHDSLREVIEGPASVRVLYFESPELVDALITEVIQTPGALPLLSFTLSEMYIRYLRSGRENRALTQEDYKALGGVIGSLRKRADEEYKALPDDTHRVTMQRVMLRMVSVEGGELARRRVYHTELCYPNEKEYRRSSVVRMGAPSASWPRVSPISENLRVEEILRRLVAARLLVEDSDKQGNSYVEPAHDALVRAWPRLQNWTQEAENYLPLQRRVSRGVTEWNQAELHIKEDLLWDNDPYLLQLESIVSAGKTDDFSTSRIVAMREWLLRQWQIQTLRPGNDHWLNAQELTFVQASVNQRNRERRRILNITLSIFGVFSLLVLLALSMWGLSERRRAEVVRQLQIARSVELATESQIAMDLFPERSLLLAAEAFTGTFGLYEDKEWYPLPETVQALYDTLYRSGAFTVLHSGGAVNDLAFSVPGDRLAVAGEHPEVEVWNSIDWNADPILLRGHTAAVNAVAFYKSGYLASGSDDNTVRIWDTYEPSEEVEVIREFASDVNAVAFSERFSFEGDRMLLVAASGSSIVLVDNFWDWELVKDSPLFMFGSTLDEATDIAFLRGAKSMIVASTLTMVCNFDSMFPSNRIERTMDCGPLVGDQARTTAVAVSSDGKTMATASTDRTIQLSPVDPVIKNPGMFGAMSSDVSSVLRGHTLTVNDIAFSADDRFFASASEDHTVRLWRMDAPDEPPLVLNGHEANVTAIAFSPRGDYLVSGDENGVVILWPMNIAQYNIDIISWVCRRVERNFVRTEWEQYFGDESYRRSCPNLPAHTSATQGYLENGRRLAQFGQLESAIENFRIAVELNPDLGIYPKEEAERWQNIAEGGDYSQQSINDFAQAQQVIDEGRQMAMDGDTASAIEHFLKALTIDPTVNIDPELEAQRWQAEGHHRRGNSLAKQGNIDGAIEQFEKALAVDMTLQFDSVDLAQRSRAEALVEEGDQLAGALDIVEASAKYAEAKSLNPNLPLNPQSDAFAVAKNRLITYSQRLARNGDFDDSARAQIMVEAGRILVFEGKLDAAIVQFKEALTLDPSLNLEPEFEANAYNIGVLIRAGDDQGAIRQIGKTLELAKSKMTASAETWNSLCWWGSIYGFAEQVVDEACRWAVELSLDDGVAYMSDSRGLARALSGDVAGAIEDFEFALNATGWPEAFIASRSEWVEALREGQEPSLIFDESVLEGLRNE